MQFIVEQPEMTLGGAGKCTSFAADVFMGRPAFSDLQNFEPCMAACREEILVMLERRNNRIASLDLIVDDQGLFLIAIFTRAMDTGNAKSAMLNLLRSWCTAGTAKCHLWLLHKELHLELIERVRGKALEPIAF
mgnify:CR=1 FL=1